MKNQFPQIVIFALAVITQAVSISAVIIPQVIIGIGCPPAIGAESGYIIKQSSKISGELSITFNKEAVKIVEAKTGITYICHEPRWRWQIFNEHTKKCYECEPQKFNGNASERVILFMHEKLSKRTFRMIAKGKIMSEPVDKYWSHLSSNVVEGESNSSGNRYVEISMLAKNPLPQPVQQAVGRVYGMPMEGLPVDIKYKDEFECTRSGLLTMKLEKTVLSDKVFQMPGHWQAVNKELDVYTDPERDGDVTELLK